MQTLAIIGCGYLGCALAARATQQGCIVYGTSAHGITAHIAAIRAAGAVALRLELAANAHRLNHAALCNRYPATPTLRACLQSEAIVVAVPPRRARADVAVRHPQEIRVLLRLLKSFAENTTAPKFIARRLIFISSTSVYGAGAPANRGLFPQVTESTVPAPSTASAAALLKAERMFLTFSAATGWPLVILRVGGLVGPARYANSSRTKATANRQLAGDSSPMNLLHRSDAVGIILALLRQTTWAPQLLLNAVASVHPSKCQWHQAMGSAAGASESVAGAISSTSVIGKHVDNAKLKTLLNYQFAYDDVLTWAQHVATGDH